MYFIRHTEKNISTKKKVEADDNAYIIASAGVAVLLLLIIIGTG